MNKAIELENAIVYLGNNLDVLPTLKDNSVDSIVTDPPYELGFMGKKWDSSGIAYSIELWKECLRVLKPGGHLLSFGGTRTWHRVAVAIEDAGFEVRDSIAWMYGSGFPKSLNVGKATESEQWEGWGTALKPAFEPIVVARKPLIGTVAENVLTHGTGGLNIDGSRIGTEGGGTQCDKRDGDGNCLGHNGTGKFSDTVHAKQNDLALGRWPANVILDEYSAEILDEQTEGKITQGHWANTKVTGYGEFGGGKSEYLGTGRKAEDDSKGASRFFYVAKASKRDRNEGLDDLPISRPDTRTSTGMGTFEEKGVQPQRNFHPTVKPTALMEYLIKLVTPPGGTVLDPFTGSGSTGKAALLNDFRFIGIEMTEEYAPIIEGRLKYAAENKKTEGLF